MDGIVAERTGERPRPRGGSREVLDMLRRAEGENGGGGREKDAVDLWLEERLRTDEDDDDVMLA